jgi:SET domain-containing protein
MTLQTLTEIKLITPVKGRGLISKKFIQKGTILDIAHVLLISNKDEEKIRETLINRYTFEWKDPNNGSDYQAALAMSPCEFMNHSYNPNVAYEKNYKEKTIKFYTVKDITPGEELTINYNGKLNKLDPMWIEFI